MKWEYQSLARPSHEDFIEWLNGYGSDGWEALSAGYGPIDAGGAPHWYAILKRPAQD